MRGVFGLVILLGASSFAIAHPVPRRTHDRTIVVHLSQDNVIVNYRLEVDEFTVVFDDLPPFQDQVDADKEDPYLTYTRCYAPVLAGNLMAKLDGKLLDFQCIHRGHRTDDEEGNPLGHLRCDFVFRAPWRAGRVWPELLSLGMPQSHAALAQMAYLQSKPRTWPHDFRFEEGNYRFEDGAVRLSLVAEAPLRIWSETQPSPSLQARPAAELGPGDEARLRTITASFVLPDAMPSAPPTRTEIVTAEVNANVDGPAEHRGLLSLLLDTREGFWVLLYLAACLGAVHALTPGHGKTLVAAYLVGEHGTALHAFVLGLVTTLTHTGAVLILAAVLRFIYPETVPAHVQTALGLGGGLLIAGLGFWLFLRRLAGQSDHVHIGGAGHHHHGHTQPVIDSSRHVGWWGLIVLGVSGGIVPCWDAIAMFGFAVSAQRMWVGLPLLLAFSAGLAAVLIVIGLMVVYAKDFASSRWGAGRLFRVLPIVSAALVTVLGLWLCYDSVPR